jgi:hypothetical protein
VIPFLGLLLAASTAFAQDRDTKVRNDRRAFQGSKDWVYNDLDEGLHVAKETGKPVMVVFRCIPCEACQEFDDDVARRDPVIRDRLDEFVCVRVVQANAIDLSRFRYDFDESFSVVLMNPDGTLYGRFGTRSARPEQEDISLLGLRKSLEAALAMHRDYASVKPSLAGKQVKPDRYRTPRDYPSLAGKYGPSLNYEGQVARSCMHCHQVREAERLVFRSKGEPIPDEVLFPNPDPSLLGLTMDPDEMVTVARVAPGSIGAKAGLRPGDSVERLAGQPLLSVADLQWVLHNAPSTARLSARVRRDGKAIDLTLHLHDGWRRGDISWRASTWDLRRMSLGGLRLDDLSPAERAAAKIPDDGLALKVRHAGEFGAHAVAHNAGVRKGDVIVAFDGREGRMSESELLAYGVQKKRPGEEVTLTLLRGGERKLVRFALQ